MFAWEHILKNAIAWKSGKMYTLLSKQRMKGISNATTKKGVSGALLLKKDKGKKQKEIKRKERGKKVAWVQ